MNSSLSLEYEFSRNGDDFGWLIAKVTTPDFSGRNGMWVQWQDIADFASSLSRFPIEVDVPLQCDWGFSAKDKYSQITAIKIAPVGKTGGLITDVYLANYHEPANRCQTIFQTDYPSLIEFKAQIERMIKDRYGVATLGGAKTNDR